MYNSFKDFQKKAKGDLTKESTQNTSPALESKFYSLSGIEVEYLASSSDDQHTPRTTRAKKKELEKS